VHFDTLLLQLAHPSQQFADLFKIIMGKVCLTHREKLDILTYINKHVLLACLVDDNFLRRDFRSCGIIVVNVLAIINRCHGNAVKKFWYYVLCLYVGW
jgi:hypothetical protein